MPARTTTSLTGPLAGVSRSADAWPLDTIAQPTRPQRLISEGGFPRVGSDSASRDGWLDRRTYLAGLVGAAAFLIGGGGSATVWGGENPNEASTSDQSRDAALAAIPWKSLSPESQARIREVVSRPTIYRRLPIELIACDPDLYLFLVRNPEVIVNIWRIMGVSTVSLSRTGPYTLNGTDGQGTKAAVELIYGDNNTHVLLGDGGYEGSLLARAVMGKCILVMQSGYTTAADGRPFVSTRLDMFLSLDRGGIELIARTMQHMIGQATDSNFQESLRFVARLYETAEQNGHGVREMAGKLESCQPAQRAELSQHAMRIHHQHQQRIAAMGRGPAMPGRP